MGRNATLTYNYMNLPASVKIGSATAFTYEYDASGGKHKYVADSTFKYEGGFEYNQNNKFRRLAVTDGQLVLRDGQTLEFSYYLKDHLGNVRVVFTDAGKVLQRTDYYPFGLEIARDKPGLTPAERNGNNRYPYNGKEKQSASGYLDYGARMYIPEVGKWGVIDPMADALSAWSPYTYGNNNPFLMIDPDGMASRYNWAMRTATGHYQL